MTRISIGAAELPNRLHALYRFYDHSDVLLYVGITTNLGTRMANHSKKPWWSAVNNITVEHYQTREEALTAEKKAIKEEKPLHNRQHNEFVEMPRALPAEKDTSLAEEILHGVLGIEHEGADHLALIAEGREAAVADERPHRGDAFEAAVQAVTRVQDELFQLKYKIYRLTQALPSEHLARIEADGAMDDGLLRRDQTEYFGRFLELLTLDIEWQELAKLPVEERDRWMKLAYTREDYLPVHAVTAALGYAQAHRKGVLNELLGSEDRGDWFAPIDEEGPS